MNTAIIACCKMEEAYIREWIDWHLNICKFTHIFLCDNNDTGYKYQLIPLIQDYINTGRVTVYNYNDIHPIQPHCYDDIYQKHGYEYDWFIIIDIDEFYCLPKYNNDINKFLNTVPDNIYNIRVLWRMYGDNELIEYEDKPVQERFIKYSENEPFYKGMHRVTKPIFRGKHYYTGIPNVYNMHKGIDITKLNGNERYTYDVLFNRCPMTVNNFIKLTNNIKNNLDKMLDICYIKHYASKTIDEWVKYKMYRGDTLLKKDDEKYPYNIGRFWKCNKRSKEKIDFINDKYNLNYGNKNIENAKDISTTYVDDNYKYNMKVASCSIVRLENLYIREFVEHQKNIGFDKVFIYDHNLPDGEHLEEVIDDYIQSGFVEVIDFRVGHKMGPAVMEAFQHCWDNYRKDFDWILFCDNDEFLTFTQDKTVKEYLSRRVFQNVDIIKINWLCYDDNDLLYYDNRPLNERFTRPCNGNSYNFDDNHHIKSFINCRAQNIYWVYNTGFETIYCGGAHCPCRFIEPNRIEGTYDISKIIVNNKGEILSYYHQSRESKIKHLNFELAYLKHFRMKTIEEYVKNKRAKLPEEEYENLNFNLNLFFKYNKQTAEKTDIYHKLNKNIENRKDISTTYVDDNYKLNKNIENAKDISTTYVDDNYKYNMKVASCSIVRLENLYIREFVEHQKNIGFDKVFIYDHNLPDGEHLEEVIDDYIQSGFVEVIDFREGHKMGPAVMEAFQHCWDNYRKDFDWILFCDNDEFLTFTQDKTVKEYLSRNVFKTANIIKINWLCYDDNDLLYYDNRPLNERFTRLCNEENPLLFKENHHIKCIINCKTENINLINGSAHAPNLTTNGKHPMSLKYYDSSKIVVDGGGNKLDKISQIKIQKIRNINYDLAYLKHFRMKTIEEYVINKRAKLPKNEYTNLVFDIDLFLIYNKETEEKINLFNSLIEKNIY